MVNVNVSVKRGKKKKISKIVMLPDAPLPPAAEISKDHNGPIGREQEMLSETVLTVSAENWIQVRVLRNLMKTVFKMKAVRG